MDHPRQILKLEGLTEVLDLGIANLAAATLGAQPHDIKESHLRHKPQPPQISTCSAWEVKNWRVSSWRVDNGLGLQIFQDDRRWVIVQPKTSGANLQQVCKLKCLQKTSRTSKNYPWSNFIYWIYLRCQWVYLKMFSYPTLHATGKWRLKNHGCYSRPMLHPWTWTAATSKQTSPNWKKRENHEKPWKKKRNSTNHSENIIFHPPPFFQGSSHESPTASAAASPATSGADMEQIWREKQLRAKETSPNFCHGNGNINLHIFHKNDLK